MKTTALLLSLVLCTGIASAADWTTARGNPQRTGNVDGQPGPAKLPRVLWSFESTDNFLASVSPSDKLVYVPALGGQQAGVLHALETDASAAKRQAWFKTGPLIKLPTVSSPAVATGRLIFGDGMHQNESPTLYALDAATGRLAWQFHVPGPLIHIEGTPAILGSRIVVGTGDGGVICVDGAVLTLDGKEVDAAAVTELQAKKWKELQEKYEADKKKDPDFAIPPSEEQLPRPAPKLAWQAGSKKQGKPWHVDSPVAAVGENVLVTSAFLETEQTGDRAAFCLNAADGSTRWRTELKLNPWAGTSVSQAANLVIVGCSNIRLDPLEIPKGKGEVVALNIADGSVKWRKEIATGGVVAPVAIAEAQKLAIFTTTDKKVYAVDLNTGQPKWTFENKAPYFGGVAIAGNLVYAADLNGVIQAINLADGTLAWRLDVGKQTKAPGNIYGSPVVHGGRIYVATCNLEAVNAKTVVVCLGEK